MSSDGVSAVTVTRDDSDDGNADTPGSSGDRDAETDGHETLRLRLFADLTYSPCYINTPLYARNQLTYQPTTGIRKGLDPVHLKEL